MEKIFLLAACIFSLSFYPVLASPSRDNIITDTLDEIESGSILSSQPQEYASSPAQTSQDLSLYEQEQGVPQKSIFEDLPDDTKPSPKPGHFYLSGGYDCNRLYYKELDGRGNIADKDIGNLNGFYITAGYRSSNYISWILGKPFIEAYFNKEGDTLSYDGRLMNGSRALYFKQRADIDRYGLKLGAYGDFSPHGEIFGYFDLGYRSWKRDRNFMEAIDPSLILTHYQEDYRWGYLGGGGGVNYRFTPKFSIGVEGELMYAPKAFSRMRDELNNASFKLNEVYGAEIKLPFKYELVKNLTLNLTPYYTYWEINASDNVILGGIPYYEPDSQTHVQGILSGLTYTF